MNIEKMEKKYVHFFPPPIIFLLPFRSFLFSLTQFSRSQSSSAAWNGRGCWEGDDVLPPKVRIYQVKKDHEVAMAKSHQEIHQITRS